MKQISRDELTRLAKMSSLALQDDEVDELQSTIDTILGYVNKLDELDTDGVEPVYQVTDLHNVWRQDEPSSNGPSREQLLALAPEQLNHQVKVPKVL